MARYTKEIRQFITTKIILTQREWGALTDNMLHILNKNLRQHNLNSLLDVGCGDGSKTLSIANCLKIAPHRVFGMDIDDESLAKSRSLLKTTKIDLETDIFPFEDNHFDLVTCHQVLEHLKNYRFVMDEAIRVTRTDGFILFGVPNLAHLMNRLLLLIGRQPMCIELDGSHVRGFTHHSFLKLLESIKNIRLIDRTGVIMYPLPYHLAQPLAKTFTGLSGYVCYLVKKIG
jgi:2-polyprenyl-3-methyl-5-hydroxy-6-metoxy-1,4-benzoquinol methylase